MTFYESVSFHIFYFIRAILLRLIALLKVFVISKSVYCCKELNIFAVIKGMFKRNSADIFSKCFCRILNFS